MTSTSSIKTHLTSDDINVQVNVQTTYSAITRTGGVGRRLSSHNNFWKQKIFKFFCKRTNHIHKFEGCFARFQVFKVVYHLQNFSGKSSWKVTWARGFVSSQRKISGSNGTSEKVVLFFRMEYSKRKFVIHFFKAIFNTSFQAFAVVFR